MMPLNYLFIAWLFFATSAFAQAFPSKPVRIVVPYPPAGSSDFVARALQLKLQELWHQAVLIDNRGGASGMIGSDLVAKAQPDGYTLLFGGLQTHAMNVAVIRNMPYDPVRDFTAVTQTTRANWMLVAHPSVGVKTPADLVSLVRAHPDKYTYASSGKGSAAHLAFSMLASELNLKVVHVPYKGIGQGIADTLGGRISFVMGDQSTLVPHIRSGRLTAVAMTGAARTPLIPELPTLSETLVPGFDVQSWHGIWAPPGTSAALAKQINATFGTALKAPDTIERLRTAGVEPVGSTSEEFAEFVKREVRRWSDAARKANIEPE